MTVFHSFPNVYHSNLFAGLIARFLGYFCQVDEKEFFDDEPFWEVSQQCTYIVHVYLLYSSTCIVSTYLEGRTVQGSTDIHTVQGCTGIRTHSTGLYRYTYIHIVEGCTDIRMYT